MKSVSLKKSQVYSAGYMYVDGYGLTPGFRIRPGRRLRGFLLSLPGRFWRVICFKMILLTIFAVTTGFFVGATWAILELDDLDEEGAAVGKGSV